MLRRRIDGRTHAETAAELEISEARVAHLESLSPFADTLHTAIGENLQNGQPVDAAIGEVAETVVPILRSYAVTERVAAEEPSILSGLIEVAKEDPEVIAEAVRRSGDPNLLAALQLKAREQAIEELRAQLVDARTNAFNGVEMSHAQKEVTRAELVGELNAEFKTARIVNLENKRLVEALDHGDVVRIKVRRQRDVNVYTILKFTWVEASGTAGFRFVQHNNDLGGSTIIDVVNSHTDEYFKSPPIVTVGSLHPEGERAQSSLIYDLPFVTKEKKHGSAATNFCNWYITKHGKEAEYSTAPTHRAVVTGFEIEQRQLTLD